MQEPKCCISSTLAPDRNVKNRRARYQLLENRFGVVSMRSHTLLYVSHGWTYVGCTKRIRKHGVMCQNKVKKLRQEDSSLELIKELQQAIFKNSSILWPICWSLQGRLVNLKAIWQCLLYQNVYLEWLLMVIKFLQKKSCMNLFLADSATTPCLRRSHQSWSSSYWSQSSSAI